MKKSGLADSPFFTSPQKKTEATPPSVKPTSQNKKQEKTKESKKKKAEKPSNHDAMTPRHHDTMVSRYHDTTQPQVHGVAIEIVRKAVKEFGKEAATHRFTVEEKREIADLIYTYKNQGVKTSENEITRIAVNFIFNDYKDNGENSVLNKLLEALNE